MIVLVNIVLVSVSHININQPDIHMSSSLWPPSPSFPTPIPNFSVENRIGSWVPWSSHSLIPPGHSFWHMVMHVLHAILSNCSTLASLSLCPQVSLIALHLHCRLRKWVHQHLSSSSIPLYIHQYTILFFFLLTLNNRLAVHMHSSLRTSGRQCACKSFFLCLWVCFVS